MGRYPHFSETLPAQVRRCFSITQAELARWLGLGVGPGRPPRNRHPPAHAGRGRRQEALGQRARHLIDAAAEGTGAGGVDDFFENVGAEEIDLLTPFLTTAIAAVQTRHDALPS